MILDLSPHAINAVSLALQGHGAAIQNTIAEIERQLQQQQQPNAVTQLELPLPEPQPLFWELNTGVEPDLPDEAVLLGRTRTGGYVAGHVKDLDWSLAGRAGDILDWRIV